MSFFRFVRTRWEARRHPNMLLVHYNDLKAGRAGEMRRVAGFVGIDVPPGRWPGLVAAGFEAMRRDGDALMGGVAASFEGGGRRFFNQGTNGRWRGVFREEDLALYEARVAATLPAGCARWVAAGRLKAGEAPFGSGLRRLAAVAAVREKPAAWNARGGCTWAA